MREAARCLHEGERIVNFSMSFPGAPNPGYGIYFVSKAANEQLTAIAAKELCARRITNHAVRSSASHTAAKCYDFWPDWH